MVIYFSYRKFKKHIQMPAKKCTASYLQLSGKLTWEFSYLGNPWTWFVYFGLQVGSQVSSAAEKRVGIEQYGSPPERGFAIFTI